MKRKSVLTLLVCILGGTISLGQNANVFNQLKAKYALTRYRTECGGWYLLGYSNRGVNYYGFADNEGNVIATNAVKYNVYNGFIELQIFDELQKEAHDQWIQDKKQYDKDYQQYLSTEKNYENEIVAYNAKVEAAQAEAEAQWKAARQEAYNIAVAKYKADQQKNNTSNVGLAILSGVLNGIGEAAAGNAAAKAVAYQPFEDRIMGERGLTVKPCKPYNPKPQEPSEPSNGYEWKTFPLLQPCPYTTINYSLIRDNKGVTIVSKNGMYGLANASLQEILPCEYSEIKQIDENFQLTRNNKLGLANDNGEIIIPCEFEKMQNSYGYLLCLKDGLWGVYTTDFEELYPCQYSNAKFIEVEKKLILYVQNKGLWGALDFETGKQLLPFSYSRIAVSNIGNTNFFNVERDDKKGLYTIEGVLVMPCEFTVINTINIAGTNWYEVKRDGTVGLYDMDGIPLLPVGKYTEYKYKENKGFEVKSDKMKGFCDIAGNEIIPCKYRNIYLENDEKCFVCYSGANAYIVDFDGKEVTPGIPTTSSLGFHSIYNEKTNQKTKCLMMCQKYPEYNAYDFNGALLVEEQKMKSINKKVLKVMEKTGKDTGYDEFNRHCEATYNKAVNKTKLALTHRNSFSCFAQNYVEQVVNDWQKKGEYEKMSDWKKRVNEDTRQQKVFTLTKEAQDRYIASKTQHLPDDTLSIIGLYDADNETYNIKTGYSSKLLTVHVDTKDAEDFKNSFSSVKRTPKFAIENNFLHLSEYNFTMPNGNTYRYRDDEVLNHSVAQVDYNFDNIDLDQSGKQEFSTTAFTLGTSDVDVKIPITDIKQEKTFAVIIANEKYDNEKNVDFAYNDGIIFKEYCTKALGLPIVNVHFVPNAGLNQMRQQFNWIKRTAEEFNGEAQFIIYYAGHGMPDDATKDAYLLPTDADGTDLESAYKLSKLYDLLGTIPAKNVLVLMDACFSGAQRNGEILADARGVAIKPQIETPKGNMVVFSATTDKETAHAYKEKVHGLFTYYLLKKLQASSGPLDLGTLSDYVRTEVSQRSIVVNKKPQHPTISPSVSMTDTWRNVSVKQ